MHSPSKKTFLKTTKVHVQYAVEKTGLPVPMLFSHWVEAAVQHVRKSSGRPKEVTVRVVGNLEMLGLNKQYRQKDTSTNVLSFSQESIPGLNHLLGDLVFCAPYALREAKEQGKESEAHWAHLTIHGTLHLLGFDHEKPEEAVAMEALETQILVELGYSDPYVQ
ncbi:endoribonuclease YbeY [Gammaproteobacteria bacterium]